MRRRQLPATVERTGCLGACHREPLVEVIVNGNSTLYGPVTSEGVKPLLDQHFGTGGSDGPSEWILSRRTDRQDYPFLGRQVKVTTQLCGAIDPHSLDAYLAHDGYRAFRAALELSPEQIIQSVKDSRLRGRGGAGYPTGLKWDITRRQPGRGSIRFAASRTSKARATWVHCPMCCRAINW